MRFIEKRLGGLMIWSCTLPIGTYLIADLLGEELADSIPLEWTTQKGAPIKNIYLLIETAQSFE
ncbi:hypothetical protein [Neobacillus drentensis]|uniref:hypothetical protein n=1 Tax=Neobacillus drentensis TaxID=220684 RepID=UPI0030015346